MSAPKAAVYRWNTSDFAVGYDAAAEAIHPRYLEIQDEILQLLNLPRDAGGLVVDLGGGSGRLMERVLDHWPRARGVVIDQSEPFLALAERRLNRFGERANCVLARLQSDWARTLQASVSAFVSMSAIHHLEPAEKKSLYGRCFDLLTPGGVLINGDEVRDEVDGNYLSMLTDWAEHMRRGMASGAIPSIFHEALNGWIDRNVTRFGEPKKSGDDCHETVGEQLAYFRAAGFAIADCPWRHELWAVLRGLKSSEVAVTGK
jgi:tRNA (cmo5U34)-methyltransferase